MYAIGDIVNMKKTHPCGSSQWEILRVGIDFRLKCLKCGHIVMISRQKFEKSIKSIFLILHHLSLAKYYHHFY